MSNITRAIATAVAGAMASGWYLWRHRRSYPQPTRRPALVDCRPRADHGHVLTFDDGSVYTHSGTGWYHGLDGARRCHVSDELWLAGVWRQERERRDQGG